MRRKPPHTNAKRHHLIPESYIRRFSFDGRRVYVFDNSAHETRTDVPRNVAVESEFNSVTLRSGQKDRAAEACLAEIDDAAIKAIRKLLRGDTLSRFERWCVSFFVGYADTRGRGFRREAAASVEQPIDYSRPERGFIDQRFASAFSVVAGVVLEPRTIESMVIESVSDVAAGAYEIGCMVERAFEIARYVFWSDWCVAEATVDAEFITSDRPLAILRGGKILGDDATEPQTLQALPLSPSHALVSKYVAGERPVVYAAMPKETVRLVNASIAYRYDRELIGRSEQSISQALTDAVGLQRHKLGLAPRVRPKTA